MDTDAGESSRPRLAPDPTEPTSKSSDMNPPTGPHPEKMKIHRGMPDEGGGSALGGRPTMLSLRQIQHPICEQRKSHRNI